MNMQNFVMNMLKQNANGNPILVNVLNLAEKRDFKAIEEIGRNACKEKGIDADKLFDQLKSQYGK